jgi:hypothetical protein
MDPNFSEFSYGYAITEELVLSSKALVIAAPIFPSLYEEGKMGGGYDIKIPIKGKPIFLQFKLSDYLKGVNSKERRSRLFNAPYYRMYLRPTRHSDQHNLLLDLEKSGETVFYVAPEFHLPSELNYFYLNKTVVTNSAAFSPGDIGPLPDDDEHYIVFQSGATTAYRCSDHPVEIQKTPLKDGLIPLLESRDIQDRLLDDNEFRTIIDRMLNVLSKGEARLQSHKKSVDIAGVRRKLIECSMY